jgi:hypothetical protein
MCTFKGRFYSCTADKSRGPDVGGKYVDAQKSRFLHEILTNPKRLLKNSYFRPRF